MGFEYSVSASNATWYVCRVSAILDDVGVLPERISLRGTVK